MFVSKISTVLVKLAKSIIPDGPKNLTREDKCRYSDRIGDIEFMTDGCYHVPYLGLPTHVKLYGIFSDYK